MNNIRPPWDTEKYDMSKINLSNNVCYDTILNDQVAALIKTTYIDMRQYPNEVVAYRAISEYYNIPILNTVIGYGLGELITRVLKLPQIKKISIVSPTWQMVEEYCKIYKIQYSTTLDYSANVLYLANPNGMNGSCLTRDEVITLINQFELVIVDEAYGEFAQIPYSVCDLAPTLDNLIVLKTFSKMLGVAGLRLGYAFASQPIILELQNIRPSGVMNSLVPAILAELFKLIPSHVERMQETKSYIENKYDCIPTHGNYVLLKNPSKTLIDTFIIRQLPNNIARITLTNKHIITQCL